MSCLKGPNPPRKKKKEKILMSQSQKSVDKLVELVQCIIHGG